MYDYNVYYNPNKFDLILVGEVELSEPDYSFDLLAVWKDSKGNYYLGTDQGCSCPSPFENYNGLEDLTGPLTKEQVMEEATSLWVSSSGSAETSYDPQGFEEFLNLFR